MRSGRLRTRMQILRRDMATNEFGEKTTQLLPIVVIYGHIAVRETPSDEAEASGNIEYRTDYQCTTRYTRDIMNGDYALVDGVLYRVRGVNHDVIKRTFTTFDMIVTEGVV